MNKDISFYNTAVDGKHPKVSYDGSRSVINLIEPWERDLAQRNWYSVKQSGWFDGNSGCLWDASKDGLTYIAMPFSLYNALSYFNEKDMGYVFSEDTKKMVRALVVACSIETSDEKVIVQTRADGLLASGKLDASAAGVGNIKRDTINLEAMMLEKIGAELNLRREDLSGLEFTGNHEPRDYHASTCTFKAKTNKEFREINEGRNKKRAYSLLGVPKEELPGFLIDRYVGKGEPQIIGDGVATLMRALPPEQFSEVAQELRNKSVNINFGIIKDREFL